MALSEIASPNEQDILCSCCLGAGSFVVLGACPLCDGIGHFCKEEFTETLVCTEQKKIPNEGYSGDLPWASSISLKLPHMDSFADQNPGANATLLTSSKSAFYCNAADPEKKSGTSLLVVKRATPSWEELWDESFLVNTCLEFEQSIMHDQFPEANATLLTSSKSAFHCRNAADPEHKSGIVKGAMPSWEELWDESFLVKACLDFEQSIFQESQAKASPHNLQCPNSIDRLAAQHIISDCKAAHTCHEGRLESTALGQLCALCLKVPFLIFLLAAALHAIGVV